MVLSQATSALVCALFALWAFKKLVDLLGSGARQAPYPPGPKPRPIIGNMLDFPTEEASRTYTEWGRQFNSPILHVESLGNHVVILNKREDADELLEQRAKLYSDRPTVPIFKLFGWEYNIALMPYGEEWRQHRRVCQQNFNPQAAKQYETIQMEKTRQLLRGLLDAPKEFEAHSKLFSIGLAMSMMYGYEVKSIDDPVIAVAEEGNILAARLIVPGGSLINIFPFLRHIPPWVPGLPSRRKAMTVRQLNDEMMRIPTDFVKKSLAEGTAVSSLVTDFYEKKYAVGASQEEEDIIRNVAYTVYGAASDTTISSSGTFFYQMVTNPEIQKKAQAELDRVVGLRRLPTLEDRGSLPYIEAIYREMLRMRPPVPLSVPHRSSEDDHYKGYLIPKGATIFPNIWAMTHDEEVYPDPFTFKPERFFDAEGNLNNDDRILAYGFGRRVCVGKYVASGSMWLMIASVLACFSIKKAQDEEGNEIEINHDYHEFGLMRYVQATLVFSQSFLTFMTRPFRIEVASSNSNVQPVFDLLPSRS
ncbi:hypothetical protein CVT25_013781 [Psilocybe cyanescens]|uniref:Cytochrome P450 n=1 Tax=Psilocybe cyanescens TaxID=93625 RepID=A0A409WTT0_PSICY|nr:hypothetical protein CVT25_013781 [Psilocybe cyanescens]